MSDFKETCIWMSCCYAIGRKSIASVMHADDIAKHMEWMPADRWEFTGMDILREVNDRIRWYKNIHIKSYGAPTADVFSVVFQWFADNPQKDAVEYFVKHEWYVELVKGEVVRVEERTQDLPEKTDYGSYLSEDIFSDYSDYKNWIKLANLFLQKHRTVTTEFNGKVETRKMYEWWDVGVRMSDLWAMTKSSVIDGSVEYIARKTKENRPVTVRVPLNDVAKSILEKYKDLPDPNIIAKLSGHKEGSRAFARYRDVDDEMLTDLVSKLN